MLFQAMQCYPLRDLLEGSQAAVVVGRTELPAQRSHLLQHGQHSPALSKEIRYLAGLFRSGVDFDLIPEQW
jgi:hypothetical protein